MRRRPPPPTRLAQSNGAIASTIKRQKRRQDAVSNLAEYLAQGYTLREFCEETHTPLKTAEGYFTQIRRELGEQAR